MDTFGKLADCDVTLKRSVWTVPIKMKVRAYLTLRELLVFTLRFIVSVTSSLVEAALAAVISTAASSEGITSEVS
jgi:hypothetical protein